MLSANKWVDEIVKITSSELTLDVLDQFNCNYAVAARKSSEKPKESDSVIARFYNLYPFQYPIIH